MERSLRLKIHPQDFSKKIRSIRIMEGTSFLIKDRESSQWQPLNLYKGNGRKRMLPKGLSNIIMFQ